MIEFVVCSVATEIETEKSLLVFSLGPAPVTWGTLNQSYYTKCDTKDFEINSVLYWKPAERDQCWGDVGPVWLMFAKSIAAVFCIPAGVRSSELECTVVMV